MPVIFIIASLAIVAHQLLADPREALIGLGLVALGVPVLLLSSMRIVDFHNHYYPPEYVEALQTVTVRRRGYL